MAVSSANAAVSTSPLKSQTNMFSENFDDIEESLRDDLRRNGYRHVIKNEAKNEMLQCENSKTRHPSYITAFDQHSQPGNFRNLSKVTENFQPHPVAQSSRIRTPSSNSSSGGFSQKTPQRSNADDFKAYCSLLTERIRKVEEQNLELLRIAERQKFEYDKVVAQVVESEQSQRLLINECCNLRQQVQQLACHNQILKDQHVHPNLTPHYTSMKDTIQINQNGETIDFNQLQSVAAANSGSTQVTDALRQRQCNSGSALEKCTSSDLNAAVELITALQLASQSRQPVCEDEAEVPNDRNGRAISHSNSQLPRNLPEKTVLPNRLSLNPANGSTTEIVMLDQQTKRNDVISKLSFDVQPSAKATDKPMDNNLQSIHLRRDSRLRRSQTHLNTTSKHKERQRPASLVVETDFSVSKNLGSDFNKLQKQEHLAPTNTQSSVSSPNSPQASKPHFSDKVNREYARSYAELNASESNCLQRKSVSFSLLDDTIQQESKQSEFNERSHFSPDSTINISHEKSMSTESSNIRTNLDQKKPSETETSKDMIAPQSETDQKTAAKASFGDQKRNNSALSGQRYSYGYACRKSQSLDFLNGPPAELSVHTAQISQTNVTQDEENRTCVVESSAVNMGKCSNKPVSPPTKTFNDSGYASPVSQIAQVPAELKSEEESKNNQEKQRPPKLIKSHLKKKVLQNETKTNDKENNSILYSDKHNKLNDSNNAEKESNIKNVVDLSSAAVLDFRSRGYSEGAVGHKKKSRLFDQASRRQMKRQTSSGNIGQKKAVNAPSPLSLPCQELEFDSVVNEENMTEDNELLADDSFVSTNDFQLSYPDKKDTSSNLSSNILKKQTRASSKSLKLPQSVSAPKPNAEKPTPAFEKRQTVPDGLNKRSKEKLSKRSKSVNVILEKDTKKSTSGNNQSKSLVNIVKSKFGRSSTSAKLSLSSKKNQSEPSRRTDGPIIVKPVTPSMKPVLSLENVAYLPPGKDGDSARKLTKLPKADQQNNSDEIADYTTNNSEAEMSPKDSDRRSSEDVLSDEGFADGSTMERSETEEFQLPEDIKLLRSKMFSRSKSNGEPKTNTVSSTESENSECGGFKPKESSKWNDHELPNRHDIDNSRRRSDAFSGLEPGVFATGVTIVPTSALRQTNRALTPPSKLRSKKLPKPQSGNPLGRLIKNVSNHYTGSKEDISKSKDNANVNSQGKEMKKSKFSGYQRDIEQAFMCSIVQAELTQSMQVRSNSPQSLTVERPDHPSFSTSDIKSVGSIGTGSSISSIPSVGTISTNSGDVSDTQSTDFGLSSTSIPDSKQKADESALKISGFGMDSTETSSKNTATTASALESKRSGKSNLFQTEALSETQSIDGAKIGVGATSQKPSPLRNSKLAAPSKLSPAGKSPGLPKSKLKLRERSSVPSSGIHQVAKTKLAPLNYGGSPQEKVVARTRSSTVTGYDESIVDQKESFIRKLELKPKTSQLPPRNPVILKPSLRLPVPRSTRCGSTPVEVPKPRSNIPSSGLYRPKPVYNGV